MKLSLLIAGSTANEVFGADYETADAILENGERGGGHSHSQTEYQVRIELYSFARWRVVSVRTIGFPISHTRRTKRFLISHSRSFS